MSLIEVDLGDWTMSKKGIVQRIGGTEVYLYVTNCSINNGVGCARDLIRMLIDGLRVF